MENVLPNTFLTVLKAVDRPSPESVIICICPGDGTGIRVGLRSQILRVRISPGAPVMVRYLKRKRASLIRMNVQFRVLF